MTATRHVIAIEPLAPTKPAPGQPCNGCGLCCLYQPCPLGMLLSASRRGACRALRWEADMQRYRCGAMVAPREVLELAVPAWLSPVARALAPGLRRLAGRWVAAGRGCDSTIEIDDAATGP